MMKDKVDSSLHKTSILAFEACQNIIAASLVLIGSELLYRLITIAKEMISYFKYYPRVNRYTTIIKHGFHFNSTSWFLLCIFGIICSTIMSMCYMKIMKIFIDNMFLFIAFIVVHNIFRATKLYHSRIDTAEWIRSTSGLDYATGMASNYFHGYLYLQLPDKGDEVKSIRHRMDQYEDKHGVKFAVKRLFILVPDSLHCKPKIESKILEKAEALECVNKDRAGVRRPFKNDVYKFREHINGKIYYISVEGATPLVSFYEAMNFKITQTSEMEAMRREILLQFYKSLKKFITECPDTRNECEIVYYNDRNERGDPTDVGLVLKHRIDKMLREGRGD